MSKRIFVGNLSFDTSETDLQQLFASYNASSATIPTDYDGRSKGFGFVELPDEQMNPAIAALNGKEIGGRSVTVNEARPRPERSGNGNSGGNSARGNRW